MINLISNAIKFSPEKATIWVLSENTGNKISISVKDEGLGIPEEDKKHLFERFFRGKNVVNIQGTGLGLHIVSRYIDLMGGSIEVQSELEKGTAFTSKSNCCSALSETEARYPGRLISRRAIFGGQHAVPNHACLRWRPRSESGFW
ncbi:MAG: ATP-binding protein, partial [Proteobacteria bacterium]|nr:ATP-binding protein [Pseudomonadota bacterium]